jgi:hypothetical protein
MSRATKVYHDRQKAGLDTSAQNRYIKKLQSYGSSSKSRSSRSSDNDRHFRSSGRDNEDIQEKIKELAEAQRRSQISQLDRAKSQALSNLNAEEQKIKPKYYEARRITRAESAEQAKNWGEYLAQRGLTSSGVSGQGELSRMNRLQGNIGELNNQETNAFADIAKRRSDVENAYLNDVNSVNAGIDAQTLQSTINQMNLNRQYNLSLDQYNSNKAFQEAGLTGNYNGQQTLQGRQVDAQLESQKLNNAIAKIQLEKLPQKLEQEIEVVKQQLARGDIDNQKAKYQLDQLLDPDSIYNKMQNAEYRSTIADIAYRNKATNLLGTSRGSSKSSSSSSSSSSSQMSYKSIQGIIEKNYIYKDPNTGRNTIDQDGLDEYITNLYNQGFINKDGVSYLANLYGLKPSNKDKPYLNKDGTSPFFSYPVIPNLN